VSSVIERQREQRAAARYAAEAVAIISSPRYCDRVPLVRKVSFRHAPTRSGEHVRSRGSWNWFGRPEPTPPPT
jgi:hypothetical protein